MSPAHAPIPDEPPRVPFDDLLPESGSRTGGPFGAIGTRALRLGVSLALLGLLALLAPWGAATAIDILCGAVLVAAGIGQLVLAAGAFDWRGFWLTLVCGSLSLVGGTAMLVIPRAGVGAIVVFVGLLLAFEAAAKFTVAWTFRDAYPVRWILFDGLLTTLLATVMLTARGDDRGTLLGVLVGVNLLSSGLMFAATGWTLRRGGERFRARLP